VAGSTEPTRRQRILAAMLERVEQIRTENGFNTEVGWKVFLGETPILGPSDPEAALAIVIREDAVLFQAENLRIDLFLEFQALARADINHPWVMVEQVLADIKRAIELPDRTLGRLVPNRITRGSVRTLPREPGSTVVGVGVTYTAPYLEAWGNP
jgi:hypothetical protein